MNVEIYKILKIFFQNITFKNVLTMGGSLEPVTERGKIMTKFYMIKNKKILDAVAIYKKNYKERNKFIVDFYSSHGIDGNQYYLGGDGPINKPFTDTWKKHIVLHVENTTNNLSKFATEFKRSRKFDDLYEFKKTSKILKEFQEECINKKVIINLEKVYWGDYFKDLCYKLYSYTTFSYDGILYLGITCNSLEQFEPKCDGVIEINGSEFYKKLEKKKELTEGETK